MPAIRASRVSLRASRLGFAHGDARTLRLPVEPELQFQPDAQTRYVVVDEVLAEIKRAGVTKLGFVGNEQYGNF